MGVFLSLPQIKKKHASQRDQGVVLLAEECFLLYSLTPALSGEETTPPANSLKTMWCGLFNIYLRRERHRQTDRQHARDKTSEPKTRVRCTRSTWRYESGTSATRCIKRSKQESKIWPWRSHFLSFICPFSYLRESKWSSRCSMSTFVYLNVHVRCMDIQLMGSACFLLHVEIFDGENSMK